MKKYIRKDDEAVSPVIAVILMVAITVVLAGVLYVWVSGFGGGGTTGISVSATTSDNNVKYDIEITKVSGGTLRLSDAKFKLLSGAGSELAKKTINDAFPAVSALTKGNSKCYSIPTVAGVEPIENATLGGSGGDIDSDSIDTPDIWEGAYFAYLDADGNDKVNAGDHVWIWIDNDDDGQNEIQPGYKFVILDGDDNKVLSKEL